MKVHPAAALFPMLDDDELQALADDIATNGLRHPVIVDCNRVLLDGRNRLAACELAGVEPQSTVYVGSDPIGLIVSENVKRRHLNAGQLAFLAIEVLPLYEAQAAKRRAHGTTAPGRTLVAGLPQGLEPKARDRAAKATGASGRNVQHAKALAAKAPDLADAVKAGAATINDAASELRKRDAKARAEQRQTVWDAAANRVGSRVDVRHGDFREVLADLEPGSVDAIVTDPPYPDDALPLWSDLAEFAAKVLRPGAPMFAWSGQYRLPEVLARITEHLDYQWTINLALPGVNGRFRATHMVQTWKPIIVATVGPWGPHAWHPDQVTSPAKDQALYEWQQHGQPAADLIARYVPEGGLVVDPFAGVGTFGIAAVSSGRRFIGAELDDERHRTAQGRVAEALP